MGVLIDLFEEGENIGISGQRIESTTEELSQAERLSKNLFGESSSAGRNEIEKLDTLFTELKPPPEFSESTLLENSENLEQEDKALLKELASRDPPSISAEETTKLEEIGQKLEGTEGVDPLGNDMSAAEDAAAAATGGANTVESEIEQAESELEELKNEADNFRKAEQEAETEAEKAEAKAQREAKEKEIRDKEKELDRKKKEKMKEDIKNSKGTTAAAIGLATVALGIGGDILGAFIAAKYLQAAGGVLGAGGNFLSDIFSSVCSSSDSLIHSKIGGIASLADLVDIDSDSQASPSPGPSPSSPVLTVADCLASPGNPKYLDTSGLVPREVDDPENEYQRQRKRICDSKCLTVIFSLIMDGIILFILIWIIKKIFTKLFFKSADSQAKEYLKDHPGAKIDSKAEWKESVEKRKRGKIMEKLSSVEQAAKGFAEGLAKSRKGGNQEGGFLNTKKFKKLNKYNKWLIVFLIIFAMIITHFYKKQRGIQKDQQYLQQLKQKRSPNNLQNNFKNDSKIQPYQPDNIFNGQYL